MMANHQVIIIKEAQNIKKIEDLVYYASNPLKSTILVINYKYKTLDKRKKVYKEIEKNGIIFESKKLYDNQVPEWINNYLKNKNRTIDQVSSMLLTEFLGTDLSKIVNELEKLIITVPQNEKITPKHIEDNIGISKDYNNFELQSAIIKKDILKANRIVNYFSNNPKDNPIVLTITSLYYFFVKVLAVHYIKNPDQKVVAAELKVNPYFVKDYISASKKYELKKVVEIISFLREYDLKSKGYGSISATSGELLKELIFKILH
jgi:DNA polymerase-3 subunit delta